MPATIILHRTNPLGLDKQQNLFLKALGNESCLRILSCFNSNGQQTIYYLHKRTGLDRKIINKHLPLLQAASLVRKVEESRPTAHNRLRGDMVLRTLYGLNYAFPWMAKLKALLGELSNERNH